MEHQQPASDCLAFLIHKSPHPDCHDSGCLYRAEGLNMLSEEDFIGRVATGSDMGTLQTIWIYKYSLYLTSHLSCCKMACNLKASCSVLCLWPGEFVQACVCDQVSLCRLEFVTRWVCRLGSYSNQQRESLSVWWDAATFDDLWCPELYVILKSSGASLVLSVHRRANASRMNDWRQICRFHETWTHFLETGNLSFTFYQENHIEWPHPQKKKLPHSLLKTNLCPAGWQNLRQDHSILDMFSIHHVEADLAPGYLSDWGVVCSWTQHDFS